MVTKLEIQRKKVLLVGGGIGVCLRCCNLAKQYGENATVVIGFRSKRIRNFGTGFYQGRL